MNAPRSTILRTRGIVLRIAPFSRTSQVVTWLTSDRGKLVTIVKGAQRPKSAFLGQYDAYYTCDVLFYSRDREGAHILRECSPAKMRTGLRGAWRAAVCASYLCDLCGHLVPAGQPNPEVYDLLNKGLDRLASGRAEPARLCWFELHVLRAAGLSPQVDRCGDCGRTLAGGDEGMRFSAGRGVMLCGACSTRPGDTAIPVAPPVLDGIQRFLRGDIPESAGTGPATVWLDQVVVLLGRFLDFHVQMDTRSRAIALQLLS